MNSYKMKQIFRLDHATTLVQAVIISHLDENSFLTGLPAATLTHLHTICSLDSSQSQFLKNVN